MSIKPVGNDQRLCGMHWLRTPLGTAIALQWNPGSQTWTHCNQHDVYNAHTFNTEGWTYLCPIPLPPLE